MAILHPTKTLTALVPRYVTRFSCIGPSCEHNCCTGWSITLDKKTFQAYRRSTHPKLRQAFSRHIKRNGAGGDERRYGKIELDASSKQCPLMDNGLCGVQKNLNESYLSGTCFNYPRQTRSVGKQIEQALMLSCPEAARQALLQPDAFDFTESRITIRPESTYGTAAVFGMTIESMSEVRIFCLQLMRTRALALWQRLAILGVFCEALTATLAQSRPHDVPLLLAQFSALVEQGGMTEALRDLQPNYDAQAMVFATLMVEKGLDSSTGLQSEVMRDIAFKLGADGATGVADFDTLIASYRRGVQRLDQVMEHVPYLLEHYILNEMFLSVIPFDGKSPFDCYLQLISRFGLLRLMLAARCNTENELPGTDLLVSTVHIYCRRFQHDPAFSRRVNGALEASGWASLEKIYGFLRT